MTGFLSRVSSASSSSAAAATSSSSSSSCRGKRTMAETLRSVRNGIDNPTDDMVREAHAMGLDIRDPK